MCSWFLIQTDGCIISVLPYLRKYCSTQAIPLDQLLRDEEFPETERLLKSSGLKFLNMIADRKVTQNPAPQFLLLYKTMFLFKGRRRLKCFQVQWGKDSLLAQEENRTRLGHPQAKEYPRVVGRRLGNFHQVQQRRTIG